MNPSAEARVIASVTGPPALLLTEPEPARLVIALLPFARDRGRVDRGRWAARP